MSRIRILLGLFLLSSLLFQAGCTSARFRTPRGKAPQQYRVETTGYCNCAKCCGWKRNWLFQRVYASGPLKGERKKVGQTASGVMATRGTIAADTSVFPMGTLIRIPGYGTGQVEDRGGSIKGYKLDLWFPSHSQALEWGRRVVVVEVWTP